MIEKFKDYEEIKKAYPKTMSKDQFYKVAHISKATALFLLQTGLVPCKDSKKKTRRYTIKTKDVISYMQERIVSLSLIHICTAKRGAHRDFLRGTS